ncbi:UNVERIFIED_CONTAM: hypothetical protein PYX00_003750 [Menopon gallinae]|uniref:Alpha/beta hydrolase fold-3 domain-containing protein n=1 Tax=Menopon gallinae TaxID=328185 RepID=A0AAW2I1L1_9NEOP
MGGMPPEKYDLEYQYSPSRWSKRFDADAVIDAHVNTASAASQKARDSIPYEVLRYGEGKNQLIDLFGTTLPDDSPILVYVHGGYWQELDRSISAYVVEPLVRNGIRVAVVGYDLAPSVTLRRIVEEMGELDAFLTTWCTSKAIWLAGHSAGAHLVGSLLKNRARNESVKVTGMIFISGIYDLVPLVETYVNNELKLTREEARLLSLYDLNIKDLQEMKLLVAVAEYDSDEFKRQSKEFYEMLLQHNPKTEYTVIPEKDHFDIVEKLNDPNDELTRKIISLITMK